MMENEINGDSQVMVARVFRYTVNDRQITMNLHVLNPCMPKAVQGLNILCWLQE